jgi:hypothetical protein
VLLPKLARFNEFMRTHPEEFGDLLMWHFRSSTRSPSLRSAWRRSIQLCCLVPSAGS